jgi:hypothetical protein
MPRQHSESQSGIAKELVYYHRSYRKIPVPQKRHLIPFVLLLLGVEGLICLFFPDLNYLVNGYTQKILIRSVPFEDVSIIWTEFLWRPITVLNIPGSYPARGFTMINVIVALFIIFILPQTKAPKPITVPLTLMSLIHLVSSLLFLFVPDRFPYRVIDFSTTYVVMVIVTWFLIPVVYGFTLYPLPSSVFSKILIILFTLAFSATFNIFRYSLFLYLINAHSFIFMAILFFCFGFLVDMIFIVGFYSFYLSLLSRRLKHDMDVWQWLY